MVSSRRRGLNEDTKSYGSAAGRDYNDYSLWEDATDNDLVVGTITHRLESYRDQVFYDDRATISDINTNSSYFRYICAAPGHENKGGANIGVKILSTTSADIFSVFCPYFGVYDIVLDYDIDVTTRYRAIRIAASGNNARIVGCIVDDPVNASDEEIGVLVQGVDAVIVNNIFHGMENNAIQGSVATGCFLYNNTIYASNIKSNSGSSTTARNCLVQDSSSHGDGMTGAESLWTDSEYNATDDNTAVITDVLHNITAQHKDGLLLYSDKTVKHQGKDLSSDSDFSFDDDIRGNKLEAGKWPIGANRGVRVGWQAYHAKRRQR